MRSLTAPFTIRKNTANGPLNRTLLEIDASPTRYLSDQPLTVSGQDYNPVVMGFGPVKNQVAPGENVVRTAAWRFKLSNIPQVDADLKVGQKVRGYLWHKGLGVSDKLPFFTGIIKGFGKGSMYELPVICEGMGEWFNKTIGQLMTTAAYPYADPDDIGKMIPIGYGALTNHRCLASRSRAVTTLAADITSSTSTTPIEITDVSRFPDGLTDVYLGDETIRYSETYIDGNDRHWLQGTITRGQGGTPKSTHSKGDAVLQKGSVTFKAFKHAVQGMSRARVVPYGHPEKDAVLVHDLVSSYDLTNAEINFDDPIAVAKRVKLAIDPQQTQTIDPGSHPHTGTISGPSSAVLFGIEVAWQGNVTDPGAAFDQNESTFATLSSSWSLGAAALGLNFIEPLSPYNGLTIVKATACIRHAVGTPVGSWRIRLSGKLDQALTELSGSGITQKFIVAGLTGETDWEELNGLEAYLNDTTPGAVMGGVYELWWEIKFTAVVSIATNAADGVAVSDTTDAVVGGDSVTDLFGGYLIVDADCQPDDGSGTYTDDPDSLIERPGHVIYHLVANYSNGATAADVDLAGSFADAQSNLPASYKFGFAITEQTSLNRLLAQLAWQCWCRFLWGPDGKAMLMRIRSTGTPDKVLDTDGDALKVNDRLAVEFTQPGLDDEGIKNYIKLHFNLDPTAGGRDNPDAYTGLADPSDPDSITDYKTRERTLLAFAINDQTMAEDVADNFLERYKYPRRTVTFPSWLKNVELEPGDLPQVTCTQLSMYDRLYEMLAVDYNPPVPSQRKGPELWFRMIDLLFSRQAYADICSISDSSKTDIDIPAAESVGVADVGRTDIDIPAAESVGVADVGRTDIDIPAAESVGVADVGRTDIDIPAAESVGAADTLNHVHSAYYFDSALYFDSTRTYNESPP